jgi:hypothetical protein
MPLLQDFEPFLWDLKVAPGDIRKGGSIFTPIASGGAQTLPPSVFWQKRSTLKSTCAQLKAALRVQRRRMPVYEVGCARRESESNDGSSELSSLL